MEYNTYGEAMRALGYFWVLALGRILIKKSVKISWAMFKGYLTGKDRYETPLRKYVLKIQRRSIRKLIFRF